MASTFVHIAELGNTGGGGGGGAVDSVFSRTGTVTAQAGDYSTTLVTEGTNLYFTTARVRATALTGYVSSPGVVAATDNIVDAIEKLNGNTDNIINSIGDNNGICPLDGTGIVPAGYLPTGILGAVVYQGSWNANTNSPTITSSVGTQGYYYVVGTAGSTTINGISSWAVGDWIIFNGTIWEKVDNAQLILSVNGQTGVVVLDTGDVAESGNLYFTEARTRGTVLTGFVSGAGTVTASDTILTAINKLSAISGSVDSVNGQTGVVVLDTGDISESGNLYYTDTRVRTCVLTTFVEGAGTVTNSDTVVQAINKLAGNAKVQSVNSQTGAVVLTTTDISEGSNLYFTNARTIGSTLTGFTASSGIVTSSDTVLTALQKLQGNITSPGLVTLTDGATVTPDLSTGQVFKLTLGGNRTFADATNQSAGQSYVFFLVQDGTGNRTLTFGSNYRFMGAVDPILTTTANATDIMNCTSDGTNLYCSFSRNYA